MEHALLEIQVTAQRVQRFASHVELDNSAENRELWRAALDDLRAAIRQARMAGLESGDIRQAALGVDAGRFARLNAAAAAEGVAEAERAAAS